MNKKEAIHAFVEKRIGGGVPTEWIRIIAEKHDIYAPLPMWGTMWIVGEYTGKQLMDSAVLKVESSECENHDKDTNCDRCDDEEMVGAYAITDKEGVTTAAYIYDIDGTYVLGIHGAGWDFYDGVWDKIYDALGLEWHDTNCTHFQCNAKAVEGTDACEAHTFCDCPKVNGKYHAHYKPECPKKK